MSESSTAPAALGTEEEATTTALSPPPTPEETNSSGHDDNTAAAASSSSTSKLISKEELTELVRAIKFAKPDASQRQVYREITQEIPQRFPQFAFLQQAKEEEGGDKNIVEFNDVRKVWKKATTPSQQSQQSTSTTNPNDNNADLAQRLKEMKVVPQVFTVGDVTTTQESSLSSTSVAQLYMSAYLEAEQQEKEGSSDQQRQQQKSQHNLQDYVHVFLNVPADTSGTRPHQALINFQQPQPQPSSKPKAATTKSGSNKKKHGKKKVQAAAVTTTTTTAAADENNKATTASTLLPFDQAIIVKIQMAAPLSELDTVLHPMLLYDQSRTLKTFVHPQKNNDNNGNDNDNDEEEEEEDGYRKIAQWIATQGESGAGVGGTKAYFYARLTQVDDTVKKRQKGGIPHNDILSVYIKELAPPQAW